ncbi:MAG TPA: hypothetical protein VEL51_19290 [Vicinamibacterales bacterium]|nr:hypothetical protein [Vicinamibacterales bacterium]
MPRTAALCCLCVLAGAGSAAAEWHITPMVGLTFGGSTTLQDPDNATGDVHASVGLAGTWLSPGIFGAEAIATTTPGFFQSDTGTFIDTSRSTVLMGNIIVTAPRRFTEYFLRPFASGGFGVIRVSERDIKAALASHVIDVRANLAGFNIGGGAIGFFSQGVGVRFDLRYYSTIHGTDQGANALGEAHLRYMVASAGLVIRR